jgi:TPR repeat protein
MMKRWIWLILAVVCLPILGVIVRRGVGYRISTVNKFMLSPKELAKLSSRAKEQSDSDAALRVYQFYTLAVTNGQKEAIEYGRIAASNGSPVMQYNLAQDLIGLRDPSKYDEAKYWLKKAAAAGHDYAKKQLEDFDSIVQQRE